MSDDLVERVAKAICTADEQNGGPPWDYVKSRLKHAEEKYRDRARAAIALTLEEAARVAEIYEYDELEDDGGTTIKPSAAIRAMIPSGNNTGKSEGE
jgi:hypothetical protein